jgi:hypothetical protein
MHPKWPGPIGNQQDAWATLTGPTFETGTAQDDVVNVMVLFTHKLGVYKAKTKMFNFRSWFDYVRPYPTTNWKEIICYNIIE